MFTQRMVCPYSALTVKHFAHFQEEDIQPKYQNDLYILGRCILYTQPRGIAHVRALELMVSETQDAIREISSGGRGYILVEDYENLVRSTPGVRRYFRDFIRKQNNLEAVIFCHLSPLFMTAVKIGKNIYGNGKPAYVTSDYAQAIDLAIKISEQKGRIPESVKIPFRYDLRGSGLWAMRISSYKGEIKKYPSPINQILLLNDSILFLKIKGFLTAEILNHIIDDLRLYTQSNHIDHEKLVILCDAEEMKGIPFGTRYGTMKKVNDNGNIIPDLVFFNTSSYFRTSLKFITPFSPFKIRIVKNIQEALDSSFYENNQKKMDSKRKGIFSKKEKISEKKIVLEDIMEILSGINWEKEGYERRSPLKNEDYEPLENLLTMIKEEVDQLFHERKENEKLLEQSKKYAALGRLASGIAHNLNNSLTIIRGYTDLLHDEETYTDRQKDYLDNIDLSVTKSTQIINNVLAYSKKKHLQWQVENLVNYVNKKIETYGQEFFHNIFLNVKGDRESFFAKIDKEHFGQAIENILNNAYASMPKGGRVNISMERVDMVKDSYPYFRSGTWYGRGSDVTDF